MKINLKATFLCIHMQLLLPSYCYKQCFLLIIVMILQVWLSQGRVVVKELRYTLSSQEDRVSQSQTRSVCREVTTMARLTDISPAIIIAD